MTDFSFLGELSLN